MEMGWNVAKSHNIDVSKVVVTGESAAGTRAHLDPTRLRA
jgi:hypothetical protein